jgi:hypothetical protein
VATIMRMDAEPIGEVLAQVAPDVSIATDPVAEEQRRQRAAFTPGLVKQGTAVDRRDGVGPSPTR